MRLEHIPLIIGAIVALIGLGFLADALIADSGMPTTDRRRRIRAERSRTGEAIVGVGTICMAAALLGRDTWRYGTIAVMTGGAFILIGIILNRTYLKEALFFRGPARRADPDASPRAQRPKAPVRPVQKPSSPAGQAAPRPGTTPSPKAPPPPQAPARPTVSAPSLPRPAAGIPTPVRPMRAVESSPKPPPEATQPPGTSERRKTPRGKK
jgi:hypothetical protein